LSPPEWTGADIDGAVVSVLHAPYDDGSDHGRAAVLLYWPAGAVPRDVLAEDARRYGPGWSAWQVVGADWARAEVTDRAPGVPEVGGAEHLRYWQSTRTETAAVQIATDWLRSPREGTSRWAGSDGPLQDSSVAWLPYAVRRQLHDAWRSGLARHFGIG
jgi:hypothetical protein